MIDGYDRLRDAGLLFATALLGACNLGPHYARPSLETPGSYSTAAPVDAPVWPSRDWWRGFRSQQLDQLIADAQVGNFDIQAAVARVEQADAQVRISGAPLLPTVSGAGRQNWQRSGTASGGTTSGGFALGGSSGGGGARYVEQRSYNLQANVSYEVDVWGRLRAQQESAEASALFSRYDQQTVALTALTSIASTWFQALALEDRVSVAERNLHDSEEILRAIRARLDAGTASLLDVSQQEALVAGLRANIPSLRSQLAQQINALGILVGRAPETVRPAHGTLDILALPELAPGLPSALLARRPDIASAEAQLIAQNANIRAARAAFFPTIQLTGSGGWQSTALSTLFGPGAVLASISNSLTQTIFDNGQLGGQYEQARGRYDELLADYRKAVVQAFTDVENGLAEYRFATEQEALEREAVATAQRAADIARAQVAAGTLDIVTALNTQTTLFTDLDLLAQAREARFLALVTLYKALGGGWTTDDVVAPPSTIFHGIL